MKFKTEYLCTALFDFDEGNETKCFSVDLNKYRRSCQSAARVIISLLC